ncbi:hypothetical protein COY61_01690 [bacterium (Candidatus Gribaldobacteria) CG_4_10_14_0_8_um_filter_33_9]|uniref:Uncharacterized protein n=1 Tax=bacterium (Candidatus Gribaldobacteria) CG_4_10_14_0_8_um_filter_33_9 TaxID=2014266 RepID=A0A2M7RMN6_9BACT|nr:MAG: hypothetical protein COY61_01690 [bacterium (Candidatus Gribaldobacteria) CG_4_10_14_0_8_um_filter_33_9]
MGGAPVSLARNSAAAFSLAHEACRQFRSKKVRISSNNRTITILSRIFLAQFGGAFRHRRISYFALRNAPPVYNF